MNQLFDFFEANPLIAILAVLVCIMILWAILNRLIKAAVILFIGIIIYAGYISYSGKQIPQNNREIIQQGREQLDGLKNFGFGLLKDFVIKSLSEKEITISEKNNNADGTVNTNPPQHIP